MIPSCCCGGAMRPEALEEVSPLLYRLRLACIRCANWVTMSGRLEQVEPIVTSLLWSNEAYHQVDRLPPYIGLLVKQETEDYAQKEGRRVITLAVFRESKNRGKVSWTPIAEGRLEKVPALIRSMAKVEIERMAIDRGLCEVTENLMDEAKAKFLGMRG
jgi:Proto-chlorophyllide reductase 57 kD subunit